MYRVRLPLNRRIRPWLRIAALLAAVARLALAIAPLEEAGAGLDPTVHVEEYGAQYHAGHSEADCAACTATHLFSRVERPGTPVPAALRQARPVTPGAPRQARARSLSLQTSRAPPLVA
jgi:hypothetical protein